LIDTSIGHDKTAAMLDDEQVGRLAHDLAGLGENELNRRGSLRVDTVLYTLGVWLIRRGAGEAR
jgi:hypothetical protein